MKRWIPLAAVLAALAVTAPAYADNPGNNNPGENNTNQPGDQPSDGTGTGNPGNNNPGENNTNQPGDQPGE